MKVRGLKPTTQHGGQVPVAGFGRSSGMPALWPLTDWGVLRRAPLTPLWQVSQKDEGLVCHVDHSIDLPS